MLRVLNIHFSLYLPGVYDGKLIESKHSVLASPALFIIDKGGKILFTLDGYSDILLEDVSKVIKQHLLYENKACFKQYIANMPYP